MQKFFLAAVLFASISVMSAPAQISSSGSSPTGQTCGCDLQVPEVLAIVNGTKITREGLNAETLKRIKELHQQIIDARKSELDLQINAYLLEAEATKRGTSAVELLQAEVVAKTAEPTEAEALSFYEQNRSRISAEFKDVKTEIISYLRNDRQAVEAKKFADRLRTTAQLKILSNLVTVPANEQERQRVFAIVNGRNITSGAIEDSLKPLIFSVEEQLYALRNKEIELRINDLLVEQEAKKKAMPAKALIDSEVNAKVTTVSDAEAEKFYNENKSRLTGEFTQLKPQIIEYLKEQATRNAESAFAERLRSSAEIKIFLRAPESPVYEIAVDDQPLKGNPNAKVTIVEFTDFQCPSCAQQLPVLERLATEYGSRVKFVIRDFPLYQHENAFKAAEAAEAAREQGKYWEYAALLYRNQSELQVDKLKQYATEAKLDRTKFDAALDNGKFKWKVQRDLIEGQRIGVNSTPSIFLNGRLLTDRSYEALKASIDASLNSR